MAAGRVVEELAEVPFDGGIVWQAPVPIDERDEEQMMRQVGSMAERQEVGPRDPQQPHQHSADDRDEGRGLGRTPFGARSQHADGRGRRGDRRQQDSRGPDGCAEPIEEVRDDDGSGEEGKRGRSEDLGSGQRGRLDGRSSRGILIQ